MQGIILIFVKEFWYWNLELHQMIGKESNLCNWDLHKSWLLLTCDINDERFLILKWFFLSGTCMKFVHHLLFIKISSPRIYYWAQSSIHISQTLAWQAVSLMQIRLVMSLLKISWYSVALYSFDVDCKELGCLSFLSLSSLAFNVFLLHNLHASWVFIFCIFIWKPSASHDWMGNYYF